MKRISSYDPDALLPKVGSRWVWEIDKPHACELIEVTEVFWNGEEWWVRTQRMWSAIPAVMLPPISQDPIALNDVSRFWEAVTPVGGGKKGLTEHKPPTLWEPTW